MRFGSSVEACHGCPWFELPQWDGSDWDHNMCLYRLPAENFIEVWTEKHLTKGHLFCSYYRNNAHITYYYGYSLYAVVRVFQRYMFLDIGPSYCSNSRYILTVGKHCWPRDDCYGAVILVYIACLACPRVNIWYIMIWHRKMLLSTSDVLSSLFTTSSLPHHFPFFFFLSRIYLYNPRVLGPGR